MILKINSNDGWQVIKFVKKNELISESEIYFFFQIQFSQLFWDKEKLLIGICEKLNEDKTIFFEQIIIKKKKWDSFLKKIKLWEKDGKLFCFKLSEMPENPISFILTEASDDFISSIEKPVLKIIFEDVRCRLEFNMIIDYSSFELIDN